MVVPGTPVVEHPVAERRPPGDARDDPAARRRAALHVHRTSDDSWYLLAGEVVVRCGGDVDAGAPRPVDVDAPRVPHGFRVVGDEPARMLAVHANASFLALCPISANRRPPAGSHPHRRDPASTCLTRAMAAHDIEVVGPSLDEAEARAVADRPN